MAATHVGAREDSNFRRRLSIWTKCGQKKGVSLRLLPCVEKYKSLFHLFFLRASYMFHPQLFRFKDMGCVGSQSACPVRVEGLGLLGSAYSKTFSEMTYCVPK